MMTLVVGRRQILDVIVKVLEKRKIEPVVMHKLCDQDITDRKKVILVSRCVKFLPPHLRGVHTLLDRIDTRQDHLLNIRAREWMLITGKSRRVIL